MTVNPTLSRAGYSFIEMLIVLSVIGIIAGIGIFGYRQVQTGQEIRSGIGSLRLIVAHAATAASSRGLTLSLVKNGNTLEVRTTDASPVVILRETLPASIATQISSANPLLQFNSVGRVVFPAGFSNPIQLSSRGRKYALTVSLIGEVKTEIQ